MDTKQNREYTKADANGIIHPTHAPAFSAGLYPDIPVICRACLNVGFNSYLCNKGINMDLVGRRFDRESAVTTLISICSSFFAAVNR